MTTIDNGVNVEALLEARGVVDGPRRPRSSPGARVPVDHGTHSRRRSSGYFGLGEEQSHRAETVFDADHPEIVRRPDHGSRRSNTCW